STTQGVVIQNLEPNGPAAAAGLKRNDVIVEFDGWKVTDMQKFRLRVADTAPGKRVSLVVLRDGKRVPLTVTLTDRADEKLAKADSDNGDETHGESLLGLKVRDLTDDEKNNADVESGVMITDVDDNSPADEGGLRSGDVVEEVGGKPVT